MHEWALADAVVATAVKIAQQQGLQHIGEINLRLGELQQIDREVFEFALRHVVPPDDPLLTGVQFSIEAEPAALRCLACGHAWPLAESFAALPADQREAIHLLPETVHIYVTCPACGSPDFEIVAGRGVALVSVGG